MRLQPMSTVAALTLMAFSSHDALAATAAEKCQAGHPAVDVVFDSSCSFGCDVATCSCTSPNPYLSSTSNHFSSQYAWIVDFVDGSVAAQPKMFNAFRIRAVRGG